MSNEFADAVENDKDKTDKVDKDNRISDFSLEESKIYNHWEKKNTLVMDSIDNTSLSFSKGQSVITWHDQEEVKVLFQSAPILNAEYYLKQTQKHAATIPKTKYKNRKFVSLPEEKSSEFYELLLTHSKTLHDKINNKSYLVLDCRSNVEFEMGHIKNSINIISPKNLIQYLFGKKKNTISMLDASTIIIFCCSNSKDISPFLMRFTRNMDRLIHHESYPLLAFPIMYLLKGGVAQYFNEYPGDCIGKYIPLSDLEEHIDFTTFKKSSLRQIKKFQIKKVYLVEE